MIYECLIAPSESPTSLREIKRALLTYDKVFLIDPSDRDIMPSSSWMATTSGMPFFSMPCGPIRPMGKTIGYDNIFERIIDECRLGIEQGLIEVISTYNIAESQNICIGGVNTGDYPLHTREVLALYRGMSVNQNLLKSSIKHDYQDLIRHLELTESLSLNGIGDEQINKSPPLPFIEDEGVDTNKLHLLTKIARARIGATVKYSGFCEKRNLIPIFPSTTYEGIISSVLINAQTILSLIEDDPYWIKRSKVLDVCHNEFMEDKLLDDLSVSQVIQLRTKAWGEQASAREDLFKSVYIIAQEASSTSKYLKEVQSKVREYASLSKKIEEERACLKHKIKCDVGIAMLGGGATLLGLMSQFQSPLASIGNTLAIGGVWSLEKIKDYYPTLQELKKSEEQLSRGAGFGLHNFFKNISNHSE